MAGVEPEVEVDDNGVEAWAGAARAMAASLWMLLEIGVEDAEKDEPGIVSLSRNSILRINRLRFFLPGAGATGVATLVLPTSAGGSVCPRLMADLSTIYRQPHYSFLHR